MRYFSLIVFALFFSCKGKIDESTKGYFSKKNFALDTVVVDSEGEIVYLKNQLSNSDVSEDKKYLFNFDGNSNTVEKINLNSLKLEQKVTFDREGPNGTGGFAGTIRLQNRDKLTLNGMRQTSLFSTEGEKLKTIYFDAFLSGVHPDSGGEQFKPNRVLDIEADRLYGLVHRYSDNSIVLGILYLEKFEISKMELESFMKLSDYRFEYPLSTAQMTQLPAVEIEQFGTKVLLSNEITSALMWYDTEIDSMFLKSYESQLTANDKTGKYKNRLSSKEEFDTEFEKYRQDINFMAPFWDADNQIFYRFSYMLTGDITKVYLTSYDSELNQIGEIEVPLLSKKPARHFSKDGDIWIFENVDDEMGFIRLKILE